MKLSVIFEDNIIVKDGEVKQTDLSGYGPNWKAIQWNGEISFGRIETDQGEPIVLLDDNLVSTFVDIFDSIPTANTSSNEPTIPQSVSPYQARVALYQAGLLANVESMIATSNNQVLSLAWEYATVFERNSVFINTLGPALGLSNEEIDQLFVSASQVT